MRSRSNREDGSSHISHPGKDAAINDSTTQLRAKTINGMTQYVRFMTLNFNFTLNKTRDCFKMQLEISLVEEGPLQ